MRKRFLQLPGSAPGALFSTLAFRAQRAELIVHLFYLLNLFAAFTKVKKWQTSSSAVLLEPSWPIAWTLRFCTPQDLIVGVLLLYICSAVLAFLYPRLMWTRIGAFFGVFFAAAVFISDVGGGLLLHSLYGFVFASFFFAFMPLQRDMSRRLQLRTLSVMWVAQTAVLCVYGLAGLWRLRMWLDSLWNTSYHVFHWDGLSNMIIARSITSGEIGIVGDWVVRQPLISTIGFLFFSGVEFFSFAVVLRPRAFFTWGILLTLFHIGVLMVMNISFLDLMMVEALLLIYSPLTASRP